MTATINIIINSLFKHMRAQPSRVMRLKTKLVFVTISWKLLLPKVF